MRMNCEDQPFLYNELAFHSERSEESPAQPQSNLHSLPSMELIHANLIKFKNRQNV